MISLILLALSRQRDISVDLEQALAGKKLAGPAFHQAIDPVLDKYGALKSTQFQHTVGDKRGMMVTLAGSGVNWDGTKAWRVFLWPENTKIRAQVIKRFGDYSTSAIDFYTDGEIYWRGDRLVIVGKDYDGTRTSRAGLSYYQYVDAHWKLAQHLASERQGFATFARLDKAIDPSRIMVRTRLRPDNFRVPSEGPMLTYTQTWLLKEGQYMQSKAALQDTAIVALNRLAGYAAKKDRKSFDAAVPGNLRGLWEFLSRPNLTLESLDKTDPDLATRFRFDTEGLVVGFAKVDGAWTVASYFET